MFVTYKMIIICYIFLNMNITKEVVNSCVNMFVPPVDLILPRLYLKIICFLDITVTSSSKFISL